MINRKSQVSTQFNWIFVLIVGGMFLVIFFTMSTRQGAVAENRISATALSGLSTIFESARTGTSLSAVITVPDIKIEFSCEIIDSNFIYSDYRVGGLSRQIPVLPTFAPGSLQGTNMVTWTQSWNLPFKVMNFLFLANRRTNFFFVFPNNAFTNFRNTINETFSNNIKHTITNNIEDVGDYNDDFTIIVIFSSDPNIINTLNNLNIQNFRNDVRVIVVEPNTVSDSNFLFGKLKFHDKNLALIGETAYYGLASFYGAIFSEDIGYYECSMRKAMKRFSRVACIYKQKYIKMRELYLTNPQCSLVYSNAISNINQYFGEDFCVREGDSINLGSFGKESYSSYQNELNFFVSLSLNNRQAILNSCELLY